MKRKKNNKKLNVKKIVILIVTIILTVVIIGIIFKKIDDREARNQQQQELANAQKNYVTLEDGTQVNTSTKILEDKNVGTLVISNVQITRKNDITTIIADVKNTGTKNDGKFSVNVTFLEKDGDKITSIIGYIQEVKPGETLELVISGSYNFVDAYDFIIEKR